METRYSIITDGQIVKAEKIAERKHWLWGKQYLMSWKTHFYNETTEIFTRNEAQWMSPKKVITTHDTSNK